MVTVVDIIDNVVVVNSVILKGSLAILSLTTIVQPSSIFGDENNFFGLTTPFAYITITSRLFPFDVAPPEALI